jgi:hypothetical protein
MTKKRARQDFINVGCQMTKQQHKQLRVKAAQMNMGISQYIRYSTGVEKMEAQSNGNN